MPNKVTYQVVILRVGKSWLKEHVLDFDYNKYLLTNFIQMGQVTKSVAILLPGAAIKWLQNQVTRQQHLHDLTHIFFAYVERSWRKNQCKLSRVQSEYLSHLFTTKSQKHPLGWL